MAQVAGLTGVIQDVDAEHNAFVVTPGFDASGVPFGGGSANGPAMFSEVDTGEFTGARDVRSGEVDDDYRQRVALDNLQDQETFNYTAQNTGKFVHAFTTLTATVSAAGLLTNSGGITTTATGMTHTSKVVTRVGGTETVVCETSVAFTAQPNANTIIDFGMILPGATTAFAPLDGVYFRMNAGGLQGIINSNGTELSTGVFPLALGAGAWAYENNETNRFLIQMTNVRTTFWINNYKVGELPTPVGLAYPCKSQALSWSVRHAIVGGAAGAACSALVADYRVFLRGPAYADRQSVVGNRHLGSHQGMSGGTMGGLAGMQTNNAALAAAAALSNTAAILTPAFGGQLLLTAPATANTDGILTSYQVPAGSVTVPGRKAVVRGVKIDAANIGAAVATTGTTLSFSIAWGHTLVSLATAEGASFTTATTKAPRREPVGIMYWPVGAAIGATPQNGSIFFDFDNPIFVNPGEFIQATCRCLVGTATGSQVIYIQVVFDYGWE